VAWVSPSVWASCRGLFPDQQHVQDEVSMRAILARAAALAGVRGRVTWLDLYSQKVRTE
jgi:hypothetical protein